MSYIIKKKIKLNKRQGKLLDYLFIVILINYLKNIYFQLPNVSFKEIVNLITVCVK